MGRPRKSSRRGCKRGRKCKGTRKTTKGIFDKIKKVMNAGKLNYGISPQASKLMNPKACVFVGSATNAAYPRQSMGWSRQQIDDQQSSGLGYGPRPFRTSY